MYDTWDAVSFVVGQQCHAMVWWTRHKYFLALATTYGFVLVCIVKKQSLPGTFV